MALCGKDLEIYLALSEQGIELFIDDERPCSVCGSPTRYQTAQLKAGLWYSYWFCLRLCEKHIEKMLKG